MACNSCARSFSLLCKEKGCPSCGFSYCSSCLNNKVFVPKMNRETKVCAKCKRVMPSKENKEVFKAPDAYYKRLAAAEEKSKNQQIQERLQNLKKDECNVHPTTTEEDIAKRLQIIKGNTPSTEELQSRLAKLRGMETLASHSRAVLPAPDVRTEQEQADDLMRQFTEQAKIDNNYKSDFDGIINNIETRVQNLRDTTGPTAQTSSEIDKNSEGESEALKNMIQKIKGQSFLKNKKISIPKYGEDPFCELCINEYAKMRCLGCGYLYCKRCYMGHKDDDDEEDGCNRYEPYTPPVNFN